mmetsp:Transcript_3492/g.4752  ORF Transcript_3492/g.4752 Transcript_3492/m.4752 type:complete len:149 (+) Transcript_3492:290-736(+)
MNRNMYFEVLLRNTDYVYSNTGAYIVRDIPRHMLALPFMMSTSLPPRRPTSTPSSSHPSKELDKFDLTHELLLERKLLYHIYHLILNDSHLERENPIVGAIMDTPYFALGEPIISCIFGACLKPIFSYQDTSFPEPLSSATRMVKSEP